MKENIIYFFVKQVKVVPVAKHDLIGYQPLEALHLCPPPPKKTTELKKKTLFFLGGDWHHGVAVCGM